MGCFHCEGLFLLASTVSVGQFIFRWKATQNIVNPHRGTWGEGYIEELDFRNLRKGFMESHNTLYVPLKKTILLEKEFTSDGF